MMTLPRLAGRTVLVCLILAGWLGALAPAVARAAMNDKPEAFCIAIPTPPFVSWEPAPAGRIYKFHWAGQASTPACPPVGLQLGKAQNFSLGVNVTGTWNGQTKTAIEAMTFGVSMHPIKSYNGQWSLTLTLQCTADPWFQDGTCKEVDVKANLPSSSDPLYSAFQFSAPFPKTSLSDAQKASVKTAISTKATVEAIEKSISIKSPKSGQIHALGAPLVIEIANPFSTAVAVTVAPKGNQWAGSGALALTTKGTSVSIPKGKLATVGEWTVRAEAQWPNKVTGSGGAVVNFVVKKGP